MKGLCITSILTSASGNFPPLANISDEEHSQVSSDSNMLTMTFGKHAGGKVALKFKQNVQIRIACSWPSTWQGRLIILAVVEGLPLIGCIFNKPAH